MPAVRIDLQEGFHNDTVIVRIDGREVWSKGGVSTRLPVGVAESFEADSPGHARLEVAVPTRGETGALDIDAGQYPYVGVSIMPDGRLHFQPSRELFRYM